MLSLQYTFTPTVTGTFYAFKVSATNAVGESTQSPEIVIIAAKVPLAPTSLQKVTADTTQITFSWTHADD
jgi:hypothetical protein